eukprot:5462987-Pyramimonas_sp.AAC.1
MALGAMTVPYVLVLYRSQIDRGRSPSHGAINPTATNHRANGGVRPHDTLYYQSSDQYTVVRPRATRDYETDERKTC